jgi:replicative DNA helicase
MFDKRGTGKTYTYTRANINEMGKLQPQAIELEDAVLGACLLERDAVGDVIDIVTPECFYKEQNGLIFNAIVQLYKVSKPIDILTVCHKLKELEQLELVGGSYYVSSLTDKIASSANIQYHARIVVQHFLKREMIRISTESIKNAYEDANDVFDIFQSGILKLESALSGVIKHDVSPIGKIHAENIKESVRLAQNGIKSGITTGYSNLDRFTNGWQKTDLIILAGRPAMGKSVCGLAFTINPALQENIPTAIFSLEMSSAQLVGRCESTLSGINSSRIVKKQLTIEEIYLIEERCKELRTAPIYIDDTPALSFMDFKGKARKLVKEKGVKLIVIDYLQLMTIDAGKGNREQEVAMISKGLKVVAKELDIPIIALSQLSRAVESRAGDKKPQLSDLRESGAIEQDADMVIFCYRPEYYGITNYETSGQHLETEGLMILDFAKHRSGGIGELRFGFNGDLTKLENYDSFMSNKNQPPPPQEKREYQQPAEPVPSDIFASGVAQNEDFLKQRNNNQQQKTEDFDDLPF